MIIKVMSDWTLSELLVLFGEANSQQRKHNSLLQCNSGMLH